MSAHRPETENATPREKIADTPSSGDIPPTEAQLPEQHSAKLIEIGWLIAGDLDAADREAVTSAQRRVQQLLEQFLPEFQWHLPLVHRENHAIELRVEPTQLLDHAVVERSANHWDIAIVISGVDLVSYHKPYALAVVSGALDAVVISTTRLDPRVSDYNATSEYRVEAMTRRIASLVLHAIGHLNGLDHVEDRKNFLFDIDDCSDLDELQYFSEEQTEQMKHFLAEIADVRLEEEHRNRQIHPVWFYVRSCWINRRDILQAVWQAKPWQFPFRLSRLTVAALSTMLIMLLTAESWDLGIHQSWKNVLTMSVLVIVGTTSYVVARQRLLLRRGAKRLTEQTATSNIATLAIVASGMIATFVAVLLLALLVMLLLFDPVLAARWAEDLKRPVTLGDYFILGAFVASLALSVGALGASFEGQHYFRHVTFVDEEI